MGLFPFQHYILQLTIAIFINFWILLYGIQNNLALHDAGFLGIRSHIVSAVPHPDVLLHWLPIEKDHWDVRTLGLIDDDRSDRTIYHIDTNGIIRL